MKVLMYSGGLDSACAYHILSKPECLNCGGAYGPARNANVGEASAIQSMCQLDPTFASKLSVKLLDWSLFMRAGHYTIPRENILAQLGWAAGFNTVLYAWTQNDNKNPERIAHLKNNTVAAVDMQGFKTDFPVWRMYRHELIKMALANGAHPLFLKVSWSCVRRGDKHCGECVNCCERFLGMRYAEIEDIEYVTNPQNTRVMKKLIEKYKDDEVWKGQLNAKCIR